MSSRIKITVAMLTLAICSCGYHLQGAGSVLPADVKNVYIAPVTNQSTQGGITTTFTESLQDSFERFGVLNVVDSPKDADAVLEAKILDVKNKTKSVRSITDTAVQFDATLTVSAELRRLSGTILWRNNNLSITQSYGAAADTIVTSSAEFAGGNLSGTDLSGLNTVAVSQGQERQALIGLVQKAAQTIYDQAVAPDF